MWSDSDPIEMPDQQSAHVKTFVIECFFIYKGYMVTQWINCDRDTLFQYIVTRRAEPQLSHG